MLARLWLILGFLLIYPAYTYAVEPIQHTVVVPGNWTPPRNQDDSVTIDLDGFIEMTLDQRTQSPQTATNTRLAALRQSMAHKQLPLNSTASIRQLQRYDITLRAQYDDSISVLFRVYKEPDFDLISDILLTHLYGDVRIGILDIGFNYGQFLRVNRSINGLAATGHYPRIIAGQLAVGEARSIPKRVVFSGNGGSVYPLPNRTVLPGSVSVFINNQPVSDYTVNYSEGSIRFKSPKSDSQSITVLYEFTNPIADFLPLAQTSKSFRGMAVSIEPKPVPQRAPIIYTQTHVITPDEFDGQRLSLPHTQLVIGSETVVIGEDRTLMRVADYDIDYRDGRITLKQAVKDKSVTITYQRYKTESYTETIISTGSKGPFYLKYTDVVPNSIQVTHNNKPLREQYDYRVVPRSGELYFSYYIPNPDSLLITYDRIVYDDTESQNETAPLQLNAVYLNEAAQGESQATLDYSETLTATQTGLQLTQLPVQPGSVRINSLDTADFDVNNYTGQVTGSGILPNQSYIIQYQYKASETAIATLRLSQPSKRGVVFSSNSLSFSVPVYPINNNSVFRVTINPGLPNFQDLTPASYEITYLQDGTDMQIEFFTQQDTVESLLPEPLPAGTLVHVYYQSPVTGSSQQLSHSVYGMSGSYTWDESSTLEAEVAVEDNNFSQAESERTERLSGNTDDSYTYRLENTALITDSERIILERPGTSGTILTRDTHYTMNYSDGSFRLRNLSVSDRDRLVITYRYTSSDTIATTQSSAYRLAGSYTPTDKLTITGETLSIDPNFRPIGTMQERSGTDLLSGEIVYTPRDDRQLYSKVETRAVDDTHNTQLLLGSERFDFGSVHTRFQYEQQQNRTADTRSQLDRYDAHMALGPAYFRTEMNTQIANQISTQDNQIISTHQYDIKTAYQLPEQAYLDLLKVEVGYSQNTRDEQSDITNTRRAVQNRFMSMVLSPRQTTRLEIKTSTQVIQTNLDDARITDVLPNNSAKLLYTPYHWLETTMQYANSASESPVLGNRPDRETRQIYQVTKLDVYPFLVALNRPFLRDFMKFTRKSEFSASHTVFNKQTNNALIRFNDSQTTYQYKRFSPTVFLTIHDSQLDIIQSTQIQSEFRTDSDTRRFASDVRIRYPRSFWRHITLGYKQDTAETNSITLPENNSDIVSRSSNQHRDTHKYSLQVSPGRQTLFGVPLGTIIGQVALENTGSDYREIRSDDRDINQEDRDALTGQLSLTPFNWVDTTVSGNYTTQFFDRTINIDSDQVGAYLNTAADVAITTRMPIGSTFMIQTKTDISQIKQYAAPAQTSRTRLKAFPALTQTAGLYEATLTWAWQRWLAVTGGGAQGYQTQSKPDAALMRYDQTIMQAGIEIKPTTYSQVTYDYQYQSLRHTQHDSSSRNRIEVRLSQKRPVYTLEIMVDWEHTMGRDFNTLDQARIKSGAGVFSAIAIRERDDTVQNISITVDIQIPTTAQYIDAITIEGGGYFSSITDLINTENSYSVGGIMITGKITF